MKFSLNRKGSLFLDSEIFLIINLILFGYISFDLLFYLLLYDVLKFFLFFFFIFGDFEISVAWFGSTTDEYII